MLKELSDLYFKEGNANAGGSYRRSSAAVRDCVYLLTEESAKGMHKGKSKVRERGGWEREISLRWGEGGSGL